MINISKPTLILDKERCMANITRMQEKAKNSNVHFRPHFKTHQSAFIGNWFRRLGIHSITVSSAGMAKYFSAYGWRDITIAFPVNLLEMNILSELANEVIGRLQGRLFIAHNARFDYGFLKNEFRRIGIDFRATVACTVKLSRRLFPGHPRHGLDALIERHELTVTDRHRALGDARLIHQFWNLAREAHPEERFAAVLKELTARPSLPSHIDPGIVEDLPEGPGVYLFHGDNALLYVGKAKNLRERVLSHFAGDHGSAKEMSLAQQLRRIEWIETGGEVGALLKEAALIKQLQPTHNRQLRRNLDLCAIRLIDRGAGLLVPEIIHARDHDFGRQANLYGLYKSAKEAEKVLFDIANAHGLCHAILGLEKVKPGKPCFAWQVKKCLGACVGEESLVAHTLRLAQSLAKLKLKAWPFHGPACLKEGDEVEAEVTPLGEIRLVAAQLFDKTAFLERLDRLHARLPLQAEGAGELIRRMRDEDRY